MSNPIVKIPDKKQLDLLPEKLPTMYDLPSEEIGEAALPDEFHIFQAQLLRETFQPSNYSAEEVFVAIDLYLYYDKNHTLWYKRPDWFAVVGVSRLYENKDLRYSYVVWQEKVNPLVVVELLSPGTEKEDLGKALHDVEDPPSKWQVYEQILKVPFYFAFDRVTNELSAFKLVNGKYQEFMPNNGKYQVNEAELSLGLWQGKYEEIDRLWLRWYDKNDGLIPSRSEQIAIAEKQKEVAEKQREIAEKQKEMAEQQKNQAIARAEQLAAKLRELGIDPNNI